MAETIQPDKATQLWNLTWDADWVTAVRFIGATRRLVAGNNLGQLLVWDLPEKPETPASAPPAEKPKGDATPALPNHLPVRRLVGHTNTISRLLCTPDGRWLISASYDRTIRVWDMQAAAAGSDPIVLNARIREEIASRKSSGRTPPPPLEAKVESQQAARVLEGHKDWILGLSMSADGKVLASGGDDGDVVVWDLEAGKEKRRWKVKGWVYALALSPDAQLALVAERLPLIFDSGRHGAIKLWDASNGQVKHDLEALFKKEHQSAAAFSSDGKVLAIGRGGEADAGKIVLVDPATGKKVRDCAAAHQYGATDLEFHPDGKHLISTGRDTVVRIHEVASGKQVKELGKPRGGQFKDWIHSAAVTADGRLLAAADMAGSVQVWTLV